MTHRVEYVWLSPVFRRSGLGFWTFGKIPLIELGSSSEDELDLQNKYQGVFPARHSDAQVIIQNSLEYMTEYLDCN